MRCPVCSDPLAETGRLQLGCARGHRFDVHKRGYVNLLPATRSATLGDSLPMLEARRAFLEAGHFSPVAQTIVSLLPHDAEGAVLDAGCGTGYYLEHVLRARPRWAALAADAAPPAVAMATRTAGCVGLVADTWQPLAVRDAAATVVLCVFAPRNPPEFRRILASGGTLVTVTPRERHLHELRDTGGLIGIQPEKRNQLDAALSPHFELSVRRELEFSLQLTTPELGLLVGMGPTAHHAATHPEDHRTGASTTVSVDISAWRPH